MLDLQPAFDRAAVAADPAEQAERRDLRRRAEILDLGMDIVGDQVAVPVDAERIAELGIGLDLEAVIVRPCPGRYWKTGRSSSISPVGAWKMKLEKWL